MKKKVNFLLEKYPGDRKDIYEFLEDNLYPFYPEIKKNILLDGDL